MAWKTLDDMDLAGKVVLTRVDINVPVEDGRVTDATRIERIVPTIRDILGEGRQAGAAGAFRPAEGQGGAGDEPAGWRCRRWRRRSGSRSPSPTTASGEAAAKAVAALPAGGVLLLENTRFHKGEEANDPGVRGRAGGARATSTATTPSRRRTGRTPRPRRWRGCCRPAPGG